MVVGNSMSALNPAIVPYKYVILMVDGYWMNCLEPLSKVDLNFEYLHIHTWASCVLGFMS